MENIRKKYICKNQIEKGISGTKKMLMHFKQGRSIAIYDRPKSITGYKV